MSNLLTSHCLPRQALGADCEREMFALFDAHFVGATPASFRRDLDNKNWVILLHDQANILQGFSTLALYSSEHAGQPISVVCSGDTIVRPEYWGTPELPRSWIRSVLTLSQDMPHPLYWLLISSGYKTYRFLSVFYKAFYPHHACATPATEQALMQTLAAQRFGQDYCAQSGLVRFRGGNTPLRQGIAEVTSERLQDEHVRFFLEKNPGHAQGDELVCLTRIDWDNFTAAGRRMAGRSNATPHA